MIENRKYLHSKHKELFVTSKIEDPIIIFSDLSELRMNNKPELGSGVHLPSRNSRTLFFSTESIINLGAKLCNMVSENIKSSESLNIFKSKIKHWTPNHCPRSICKIYIGQVGFIN